MKLEQIIDWNQFIFDVVSVFPIKCSSVCEINDISAINLTFQVSPSYNSRKKCIYKKNEHKTDIQTLKKKT